MSDKIPGGKYKMKNTRSFPRLKTNYLIKYWVIGGNQPDMIKTANTRDISAAGTLFMSDERLEEDALLRLQILIAPLEREISAFAKVKRVSEASRGHIYNISAEFLEIDKKDYEELASFIASRLQTREADSLFDEQDIVERSPSGRRYE